MSEPSGVRDQPGTPEKPDQSSLDPILSAPAKIIEYLRHEPLLLAGFGAGILVVIVGILGPAGATVYAWLVAAIVLVSCVMWVVVGLVRSRGTSSGNIAKIRSSRVANVVMTVDNQKQRLDVARHSDVSGLTMHAGNPVPRQLPQSGAAPSVDRPDGGVGVTSTDAPSAQRSPRLFVGRRREIDTILDRLAAAEDGVVLDLLGVSGVGKTSLLEQLSREVVRVPGAVARHNDRARRPDGHRGDLGAEASVAVLRHTFTEAAHLMQTLAGENYRDFTSVWEVVDGSASWGPGVELHQHNTLRVSGGSTVTGIGMGTTVNASVSDTELRERIRRAQQDLDDAFVEVWRSRTNQRPVLLTIDSFERSADDEFGAWLLRFALRLPRTVTVVARVPQDLPLPVTGPSIVPIELENFSPEQIAEYLERRLLGQPVADGAVEVIYRFTDGHPGGMMLMGELLNERGPTTVSAAELRRVLAHLPANIKDDWAKVVDEILTTIPERSAVRAAAVVSSFDEPLLASLLDDAGARGHDGTGVSTAAAAIKALRKRHLLRSLNTASGEQSTRYRMHEFIRQSVARELRAEETTWWQTLHTRAARHYFNLLQEEWENDQLGTFTAWYRYENEDWQWYKREWMYHESQLTDHRQRTRVRFARVFLDAFWWWGCYYPFPFNRDLLDDWDQAALAWQPSAVGHKSAEEQRELDQKFGAVLRYLLTDYPVGYRKAGKESWAGVADKLLLLRDLCGLDEDRRRTVEEDVENLRTTDGLISIFLAHAARFGEPYDPAAEDYYRRARAEFEALGDRWTAAWLDMEQADMAVERGRYGDVPSRLDVVARAAVEIGESGEGWDHELLASLHRVHADLAWCAGDYGEAGARYGRAVCDAYWVQGVPHPADRYTHAFYTEMVERIGARLVEIESRPDDRRAFVAGVAASVAHLPGDELTGLLPVGPQVSELGSYDSPFMTRWRKARAGRSQPLEPVNSLLAPTSGGARTTPATFA